MALKKKISYKGYEFEYWSLIYIQIKPKIKWSKVEIGLYKDEETRRKDINNFVTVEKYTVNGVTSIEGIYKKLKKEKLFKDAIDC